MNQSELISSLQIDGVHFSEVWKHKNVSKYGGQKTYFIGLNELMKNKRASGRLQDQVDLKVLRIKRKKK
jgi:hypothetical protein